MPYPLLLGVLAGVLGFIPLVGGTEQHQHEDDDQGRDPTIRIVTTVASFQRCLSSPVNSGDLVQTR